MPSPTCDLLEPLSAAYPEGLRPVMPVPDPFTWHRSTSFTYTLQGRDGTPLGPLHGVKVGGTLTWDYGTKLKVGGKITMEDTGQVIDWLNNRIAVSITVGAQTWGLGVFIPTAPTETWAEGHRGWDVELSSKLLVLDQDAVEATYALDTGTVVTTAVRMLITSAGESAGSITDGPQTLAAPMTWQAGTSKLAIINDLLTAAGYFVLQVDGNGAFRALPYVVPAQRPTRYTLADGSTAIYLDQFTRDQDIFSVPNRIIAIQQGSGDTPALVSVATNQDPTSPFSYQRRGRWITQVYSGVEATDQTALDSYARAMLVDWSAPAATVLLNHAPLPLTIYDAVQFVYGLGGINARHVVDKTTITLDPTALAQSLIRQVVTYG